MRLIDGNRPRVGFVMTAVILVTVVRPLYGGDKLSVKIIDRKNSSTQYTYTVPGHSTANTTTDLNCFGGDTYVNCNGTTQGTASSTPAHANAYEVRGATFALELPDGRIVVVNCESKYAPRGDYINRRSCRMPLVDNIQAEFKGDKAKLFWPVSIDGKKLESETYKIIGILE